MKSLIVSLLISVLFGTFFFAQPAAAFDGDAVSLTPNFISSCPARTLTEDDISYFITNDGPATDTFFLSIDWLPGLSFIQPQVTLASGEGMKIEPVWITIPYDVQPGSLFATITARSSMTGDEVSRTIEIDVLNCHAVELDVSPLERTQQVCRETDIPAVYTLEITNKGRDTETFDLETSAPWASLDRGSVTLNSGEAETFTLTANPPSSVSDFQTISVTAQSTTSFAMDSVDVFADIVDCFNFASSIQPTSASVCAGRNADFKLTITNTGLNDTFNIIASGDVSLQPSTVSVASNEVKQIDFTAETSSVGGNTFEVSVRSVADANNSQTLTGTVTGQECKGVAVIVSPAQSSVCQGESVEYTVNVRNTGSLQDSFELVSSHGSLAQTGVTLDADESMDIPLTVDTSGLEGNITIQITSSDGTVQDTTSAVLISRVCFQGNLQISPSSASVCPFTDADFDIELENTGEMEDTYGISFGNTMTSVNLSPGESKNFELVFPVGVADGGSLIVNASAESENGISLTASSTLNVKPMETCYAVSLTNGGNETVRINAASAVPLKIKNLGEQPGVFTISVQGPDYAYVEPSSIPLGFNEEKEVYLYVAPPFGAESGQFLTNVSVVSERAQTGLDIVLDVLPVSGGTPIPPATQQPEEPTEPVAAGEVAVTNDTGTVSLNVSVGEGEEAGTPGEGEMTGAVSGIENISGIVDVQRTAVVAAITAIIIVVLIARFAFLFKT